MRPLLLKTTLALSLLAALPSAGAYGLLEGFRLAQHNDPVYQAAQAEREAGESNRALGRAQLMPVISASGSQSKVTGSDTEPSFYGGKVTSPLDYQSKNAVIQLQQPLFNMQRWALYKQGKARAEYSAAVFSKKEKDLAVRYLTAYLELLLAKQNVELTEAKLATLKATRDQAKKQFDLGDGTITDVLDAEARMSVTEAQLFEARNQQIVAERTLVSITGEAPKSLAEPGPDIGQRLGPAGQMSDWLSQAKEASPDIQAAQKNVDIAEQELKKARAGHYPTLDFMASHGRSTAETVSTRNQTTTQNVVGVQVNIPIFSGGYISAQSEQAGASLRQAQAELDNARSQVELDISKQYYGVTNGADKVEALKKAVASNQEAVKGTKQGLIGGVRTFTDVLNSEEQLYQARRDLAQARYTQLVSWVQLRATSGTLVEDDIIRLDQGFAVVKGR